MMPFSAVWAGPERDEHFRLVRQLSADARVNLIIAVSFASFARPAADQAPDNTGAARVLLKTNLV